MKKFLALLLAVCMMLALVACGDEAGGDNNSDPTTPPVSNNGDGSENFSDLLGDLSAGKFAAGFGIADISALAQLLDSTAEAIDIKDIEISGATDGRIGMGSISAKLFGEKHTANAFFDGLTMIYTAPTLTDKAFGFELDQLMDMMMDLTAGSGEAVMAPAMMMGMLTPENIEAVMALMDKYYDALLNELSANAGLTVEDNGTALRINGTVTVDGIATVLGNLVYTAVNDDDLWAVLEPIVGMTKQQATAGMPDKATIINDIKQGLSEVADVRVQIYDLILQDGTPLNGRVFVTVSTADFDCEAELSFSEDSFGLSFEMTAGDVQIAQVSLNKTKLSVVFNDGEARHELVVQSVTDGVSAFYSDGTDHYQANLLFADDGASFTVKCNDQTMLAFELTVQESKLTVRITMEGQDIVFVLENTTTKLTGTVTIGGVELGGVVFGKKKEGSRTTLTFESLTLQGQTLDLSAVGLYFFFDTNPTIPAAPTSYESILEMDETDLMGLINEIAADHPVLFEKISELMGGEAA